MSTIMQDSTKIKDNVVRLRGLPFSATKQDIEKFFGEDFDIVKDGILLPLSGDGRASGQAYVQFGSEEDAYKAIEKKNKQHMGHRYIELYASSMDEAYRNSQKFNMERPLNGRDAMTMIRNRPGSIPSPTGLRYPYGRGFGPNGPPRTKINSRNGEAYPYSEMYNDFESPLYGNGGRQNFSMNTPFLNNAPKNPYSGGAEGHMVQMRGLPFQVSKEEILLWFSPIVDALSIDIKYNKDGKPSGNADAIFGSEADAQKAMTKNRQNLQHRYIELYYIGPVPYPSKNPMGLQRIAQMGNVQKELNDWDNGWFKGSSAIDSAYKTNDSQATPSGLGGWYAQNSNMGNFATNYNYPFMPMPY